MSNIVRNLLVVLFFFSSFLPASARAQEMPSDYQAVLKTLDKKGDFKGFDQKGFDQKKDFGPQPIKGGPGGGGSLFRANRYAPDHPAFAGKTLIPGSTLEELLLKGNKGK